MYNASKLISLLIRTPQMGCAFGEHAMALTAEQHCGTYRNVFLLG